ncbi:regucalcin-like isoform X1 [Lytechinus pictus]|uniref:regucalcin-like isoform X1 n=1 Tax=Lytechinus pictus TaxID=7653 RepID=UPI0030B9C610
MSIEVVENNVGHLLEGPHWDQASGSLLYVDILGQTVSRYNPGTGNTVKVNIGKQVGAVIPTRSGRTLVAATHEIGFLDWDSGQIETLIEVEKDRAETRFNDAKCDSSGRLWVGTMGFESLPPGLNEKVLPGLASLYCLHPDKSLKTHLQGVGLSNGMAWAEDYKTMYYIDSFSGGVDAFDYDVASGTIANRRRVITIPKNEGFPDGMCIDSEGKLWVAHFMGAAVKRYDPLTGEKLRTVQLPTDIITSCCWGGANLDELYVTSSKLSLSEEKLKAQDTAGYLFRVTGLGVKGVKAELFDDLSHLA